MKKIVLVGLMAFSSLIFATVVEKPNNLPSVSLKTVMMFEHNHPMLNLNTKARYGFVWYDSCGGEHYFDLVKYFSIHEVIEEIWSMNDEYCP